MIAGRDGGNEPSKDYEVGYKKPPKEHRFAPGHSKSKGRRKGSRNIKTIVEDELFAPILHMEKGKQRKTAAIQLILRRLRNDGLNGDIKAILPLIKIVVDFFPVPIEEGPEAEELNPAEQEILELLRAKAKLLNGNSND
jgi:hypothetical protein